MKPPSCWARPIFASAPPCSDKGPLPLAPFRRAGEGCLETPAQSDAVGARFGQIGGDQLVRHRRAGRELAGGRRRRAARLKRAGEGDLAVILVEDILAPEFHGPALFRPANADAGIDHRKTVLPLFGEQVRPGVEVTGHASIDIEERRQARCADIRRPGHAGGRHHLGRIAVDRSGQQEQRRVERYAAIAAADQPVGEFGAGVGRAAGHAEIARRADAGFQFDTLADQARPDIAAIAGPRCAQSAVATIDVLHDEAGAVEGVQLEILELLPEGSDVHAPFGLHIFQADFEAVDLFRGEAQAGHVRIGARREDGRDGIKAGRSQLEPIQIIAARLIALRIAAIEQQVVDRLPRQYRRAGKFAVADLVVEVERVEAGRSVAQAAQCQDAAGQRRCAAQRGIGGDAGQARRLQRRAGRVVIVEIGGEALAFMGVAQAQRQIEPIGDVDDIMGEERPILTLLPIERCDVARARRNRRQRAQAVAQARRDRPGLRRGDRRRHATRDQRGGQPGIEVRLRPGDQRLGSKAATAGRQLLCREVARRTRARHQATGRKATIIGTEADIVLQCQLFVGVIAADQPVELVVEGRPLQPQFLREGLELAIGVGIAVEKVGAIIVIIAIILRFIIAIGGDAGQLRAAEIIVDLARHAPILELADIVSARRHMQFPIIGIGRDHAALTRQNRSDAVEGRVGIAAAGRRPPLARLDIGRAAAAFVTIGIIADQTDGERVVRLDQRLTAQEIAVAVVGVADRVAGAVDQLVEAVPLAPHPVQRQRDAVGNRPGDAARQAPIIIIAVSDLTLGMECLFGRLADDVDEARRRIAAEQRALRSAQHLHPFDLAQFVEARAGARTIDAIDEDRDRAFEARIVADRADAANTGRRIGFGAGGRDEQRRRQLVERTNITRAAILHRLRADGRHRDRHIRQGAGPARGRHDDIGAAIVHNRLRRGRVLRQSGRGKHAQRQRTYGR
eukprot:Opistho-2@55816